jgi:hypothetical protein
MVMLTAATAAAGNTWALACHPVLLLDVQGIEKMLP